MAIERLDERLASAGEPAADNDDGGVEQDSSGGDAARESSGERLYDPASGRIALPHGRENDLCVYCGRVSSR